MPSGIVLGGVPIKLQTFENKCHPIQKYEITKMDLSSFEFDQESLNTRKIILMIISACIESQSSDLVRSSFALMLTTS